MIEYLALAHQLGLSNPARIRVTIRAFVSRAVRRLQRRGYPVAGEQLKGVQAHDRNAKGDAFTEHVEARSVDVPALPAPVGVRPGLRGRGRGGRLRSARRDRHRVLKRRLHLSAPARLLARASRPPGDRRAERLYFSRPSPTKPGERVGFFRQRLTPRGQETAFARDRMGKQRADPESAQRPRRVTLARLPRHDDPGTFGPAPPRHEPGIRIHCPGGGRPRRRTPSGALAFHWGLGFWLFQ